MGGWSRAVGREFLAWLRPGPHLRWLDVGCGTGALTSEILKAAAPQTVYGVDASAGFIAHARASVRDRRARFDTAAAEELPFEDGAFDVVVSGLLLNFVSDPLSVIREMARVVCPTGVVASYIWDYEGEMQPLRHFWDAARAVVPSAAEHDEMQRFALCRPEPLRSLAVDAGFQDVEVRAIDRRATFEDFEHYWSPFLAGQGGAPGYLMSLAERDRLAIEQSLRARLPLNPDGSIELVTRAWAVRARR